MGEAEGRASVYMANGGDIDGDGFSDVLVGGYLTTHAQNVGAGTAYLVCGVAW